MNAIIDLKSELLVDRSKIHDGCLRLLLAALGREVAKGSAWIAVNKEILAHYGLAGPFFVPQENVVAA